MGTKKFNFMVMVHLIVIHDVWSGISVISSEGTCLGSNKHWLLAVIRKKLENK